MTHEITYARGRRLEWADCTCGWRSELRVRHWSVTIDAEKHLKEKAVIYAVGDSDPTPKFLNDHCLVDCDPTGECTWPEGHRGQHVAGDGDLVIGVKS